MKALQLGILLAIAFLASSVVALWLFVVPLDTQHLEADITIENRAAIKLTNDSILHFGSIDTDQRATRAITLENIRDRPITASVYIDGPQWLSVSENPVRMYPDETSTLVFTADPPEDAAYGNYSWNISIVYRRR